MPSFMSLAPQGLLLGLYTGISWYSKSRSPCVICICAFVCTRSITHTPWALACIYVLDLKFCEQRMMYSRKNLRNQRIGKGPSCQHSPTCSCPSTRIRRGGWVRVWFAWHYFCTLKVYQRHSGPDCIVQVTVCDDNCSPVSIQDPIALSIRFSMEMFLSKELDLGVLNYCPIFRQECGIRNRFSYRFKAYCIVYVFV